MVTKKSRSREDAKDDLDDEDDHDDSEHDDDDDNDEDDDDDEDRTLTQEQVDKIVRRVKGKTRRTARRELLKSLGVDTVEELQDLIEKANKPVTKKKSDDSEDQDKDDAAAQAAEAKRQSERQVKELELTRKIEGMIVDEYGLKFSQAQRIRRLVEVELDADDDEIEDALDVLRDDMPSLFDLGDDDEDDDDDDTERRKGRNRPAGRRKDRESRRPDTSPARSPRRKRGGVDPKTAARTLLHERHPKTKKST